MKKTILIVTSDMRLMVMLANQVFQHGHGVLLSSSVYDASRIIESGRVDLVLTTMDVPTVEGMENVKNGGIYVIMESGKNNIDSRVVRMKNDSSVETQTTIITSKSDNLDAILRGLGLRKSMD